MPTRVLFNKTSGVVAASRPDDPNMSEEENLEAFATRSRGYPDPSLFDSIVVEDAALDLLSGGKHLRWNTVEVKGGVLQLKAEETAARTRRQAARAAKAAAKADKKLDALVAMTGAEFQGMTAAQKWDLVFLFMKANLNDD